MKTKIQQAMSKVQKLTSELSQPTEMSPEMAKEFYEEVVDYAEVMIEALKADLKDLGRRG